MDHTNSDVGNICIFFPENNKKTIILKWMTRKDAYINEQIFRISSGCY